ncbi:hypothetical protein AB0D12_40235 [Streptomyces sp. NPDC048479]|uniref:hypothetical protein n=1 Tax=Streptomyces sp. NPDC048479 TaxID=3154725 RepID=UPI00343FE640
MTWGFTQLRTESWVVLAVGILALPRSARLPWALFVLAWPLDGAEWAGPGPLQDLKTVGHLIAAILGFGVVAIAMARTGTRTAALTE